MLPVTRRRFLAAGLSPLIAIPVGGVVGAGDSTNLALKDLARAKGILYGTCISASQIAAEDDFTTSMLRECACIVPENEMKWWSMSDHPDQEDFSVPDRMADFAKEHRLAIRGHNLLWYYCIPNWFKALPDGRSAETAILRRVTNMASRYQDRVFCWDVGSW
jgi:endo-1,4-beta-xylanase